VVAEDVAGRGEVWFCSGVEHGPTLASSVVAEKVAGLGSLEFTL
jgi:hypothetical protein